MKNKKIIIFALVLLIIAGIIVVGLKGFNVDLMLKQHDSIEYTFSKDFEITDVEKIAKEVFGDKNFKIRVIEFFDDAVSINAETITTEEAKQLVKKLDEKYKKIEDTTSDTTVENSEVEGETTVKNEDEENLEIISNPKIKLSSLFKTYIIPSIISGVIIVIYAGFRYRKLNSVKTISKLVGWIAITTMAILSVLAIIRFPINIYVVPSIILVILVELIIFFAKQEENLKNFNKE